MRWLGSVGRWPIRPGAGSCWPCSTDLGIQPGWHKRWTCPGRMSRHPTCLRGCGLITATPEGRHVRYALADPALAHALADLADLVLMVDQGVTCPRRATVSR